MLLVSYILGGDEWIDRIYITYLNKGGTNKAWLTYLYEEAKREGQEDKDWLDEHKIMTFEELLGLDKERMLGEMTNEDKESADWYCKVCTKKGRPDPHVMRPWDRMNDELHGHHRSWVQEFALNKDKDGNIFLGRTPITDPDAIAIASKYL